MVRLKVLKSTMAYAACAFFASIYFVANLGGIINSDKFSDMGRIGGPVIDDPIFLMIKDFALTVILAVILILLLLLTLSLEINVFPLVIINLIPSGIILLFILSSFGLLVFYDEPLVAINGRLYLFLNGAVVSFNVIVLICKTIKRRKASVGNNVRL